MTKKTLDQKKEATRSYHYARKARLNLWRNYWQWKEKNITPINEVELENYTLCDYKMKYDTFSVTIPRCEPFLPQ